MKAIIKDTPGGPAIREVKWSERLRLGKAESLRVGVFSKAETLVTV